MIYVKKNAGKNNSAAARCSRDCCCGEETAVLLVREYSEATSYRSMYLDDGLDDGNPLGMYRNVSCLAME